MASQTAKIDGIRFNLELAGITTEYIDTGQFASRWTDAFTGPANAGEISIQTYFDPFPERLTLEEMQSCIDRVQYKPGWKFEVKQPGHRVYLLVYIKCKCSRTGEEITQCFNMDLYHGVKDEKEFFRSVKNSILDIEKHEALENIEIDKKKEFDPHKEPYDGMLKSGYW